MNRKRIVLFTAALMFASACVINIPGMAGSGAGGLMADPSAGLEQLDHFHAEVGIRTEATLDGENLVQTTSAALSAWSREKAVFLTTDAQNSSGESIPVTLGTVDKAGFVLMGGETGCRTYWDKGNIQVTPQDLGGYLLPIRSAAKEGEETLNSVVTQKYALNSDSIGRKDIQAAGSIWVAKDGGYLVKYHLVLTGGKALFGIDADGTHTIDYELTEINDKSPVEYPGDCRPVLADIPATDDAEGLERQPGALWFTSPSAPDTILSFYMNFFTGAGWTADADLTQPGGEIDVLFSQATTGRSAALTLTPAGGHTIVHVFAAEAASEPQPAKDSTPENGDQPLSVRIITSVSTLFGTASTPSPLGSYALSATESLPAAGGGVKTTTVDAEVEGLNYHYRTASGGVTKEAIFLDGLDYEVVEGKARPGSAILETAWMLWQLDPLTILSSAAMAAPKAESGTTFEGRPVDVFTVDSAGSTLPDMSGGLLPLVIQSMKGTIWIDQATGALLRADLEFDCAVRQPGETEPSVTGKGEFHLAVSRIGQVTVSLP
jgi:hypothetical protein